MAAAAGEADKAFLSGSKVTEHLEKMIHRVVAERPKDAYGLVEVISRMVKNPAEEPVVFVKEDQEERAKYSGQIKELLKAAREDPADPATVVPVCAMPDLAEEAAMLEWAGAGFGDVESYKIMCSMRRLGVKEKEASPSFEKMRFWGKILGTDADYFVVEATLSADSAGDVPEGEPDMEPEGVGVNQWVYFVTNDLCADWAKLPQVKPREIVAARKIKRLMTGKLESKVITHPYFPGTEAVLLRAEIALIASETVLCMKGFLTFKDEPPDPADEEEVREPAQMIPNENFGGKDEEGVKVPTAAELLSQLNWTHLHPEILACNGRCSHLPDYEDDENPELAEAKNKQLKADRDENPIRPIARGLEGDRLGWVIKQAGDLALYADPTPKPADAPKGPDEPFSNAVTVVRSLRWPGAVVAARGKQFTNLYVGYGLPAGEPDFFPCAPKDVADEPEDVPEHPEPWGEGEGDAAPADGDA